jgi:preprotein translocase subunit SecG
MKRNIAQHVKRARLKQSMLLAPKVFGVRDKEAAGSAFTTGAICRYCPLLMNILINVLLAIDMLVAVLMTLVILMQRPKSEGLGAAFGGGVTENIFGAQTTNVLTKFTGWLAGIFFVLTFVLGVLYAQRTSSDSSLRRELMAMPSAAPAASPAPATGSPASTPATSAGNVSPSATAQSAPPAAGTTSPPSSTVSPSTVPSASAQPSP